MLIKDIMTKEIITVKEDDTVERCANLLTTHNLSGLPVLDDKGKIKGIVTEGDLIRRASRIEGPAALEILGGIFYIDSPKKLMKELKKTMGNLASDIMAKNVITISPDEEIEKAATILVQKRIKRLPVIDKEGNLIGIVSRKDIMNHLFNDEKI